VVVLILNAITEERIERFKARICEEATLAADVEKRFSALAEAISDSMFQEAIVYARETPYTHPGLSSLAYLIHPLRVSEMALQAGCGSDAVTIALLHNMIEVASIDASELEQRFGLSVRKGIEALTVDRVRQHDPVYKNAYYGRIREAGRDVGLVKVFDKLDNLFLLCLNNDAAVRHEYLKEIECHVLPLIPEDMPELSEYYGSLINDCHEICYVDEAGVRSLCDRECSLTGA